MGVAPKYIVIILTTTVLVFIAYEIIKRISILRFLLGMKNMNRGPRAKDIKVLQS